MTISKSTKKAVATMWKDLLFIKDQVNDGSGGDQQKGRKAGPHYMDNFSKVLSCIRALHQPNQQQ
jgi:hypothetical protein